MAAAGYTAAATAWIARAALRGEADRIRANAWTLSEMVSLEEWQSRGVLAALLGLALLPPWLLWLAAGWLSGYPCPPRRDPALLVALAASALLCLSYAAVHVQAARNPEPSWLLLPPSDAPHAPYAAWCAPNLYPRRVCERAIRFARERNWHGIDRYLYAGARCVSEAEAGRRSPTAQALAVIEDALRRALGPGAIVARDVVVGTTTVGLAVRPSADAPPVLAIDATEDTEWRRERIGELARLGLADYWLVNVDPTGEQLTMLHRYSSPDRAKGIYGQETGSSANPDVVPRVAALPALRVPLPALLPTSCGFASTVAVTAPPDTAPQLPPCTGDDPDALARCTLERIVTAQAAFRARHGRYFNGGCGDFAEVALPPGVVCGLVATDAEYEAVAAHPGSPKHQTCEVRVSEAEGAPVFGCRPDQES